MAARLHRMTGLDPQYCQYHTSPQIFRLVDNLKDLGLFLLLQHQLPILLRPQQHPDQYL
jgi:hypothetical protein